jgi:N-acetylmuramic acid 6-phosphate etherase
MARSLAHKPRDLTVGSPRLSPTEARNPRSAELDRLPLEQAVRLMLTEEGRVPQVLLRQTNRLACAIALVARAFRRSGRLFYVGAGTSGRLGALDASECPPTFGTKPAQVQAILAGGPKALLRAMEGAEDDSSAGVQAVRLRRIDSDDAVVGITASGTTPFVWGALGEAKRRGASTLLVCFNPRLRIPAPLRPSLVLAFDLGPEILTGSTRLKAGTATKLILNLLTTLAMVRLGKVKSNLMVDLDPTNVKLRSRAGRIVCQLTRADAATARRALEGNQWRIKAALKQLGARPATAKGKVPHAPV